MRDEGLTPEYWASGEGRVVADITAAARYTDSLAKDTGAGLGFTRLAFNRALAWIGIRYSGGAPVETLVEPARSALRLWARWDEYARRSESLSAPRATMAFSDDKTAYFNALWIASVAWCTADAETVDETRAMIERAGGADGLLAMLTRSEPTRSTVWHARPFGPLERAMTAPSAEAERIVATYLASWRKSTKFLPWWAARDAVYDDNVYEKYFGYWAWEVAGVVAAAGIDDASLRDHPHYPRDLVDHYRRG
jgi:hypothetical protein